jgi:acyl transferase domain-containing protein/NAD(P)H-dependent flavin oxidoreductase YrpB (nitropropane dioxygenase family)/NAD(P)-dependent dehydrogenase (short-subunit alcohol dehydrogenase family)
MAIHPQTKNLADIFEIAALPPLGRRCDIGFWRSVLRAGALALLDVRCGEEVSNSFDRLDALRREFSSGQLGVRLECSIAALWHKAGLKKLQSFGIDLLLVAGERTSSEKALVSKLRGSSARIYREVVSADEARCALQAGYGGIVVKGNEAGGRVGGESTFVLLQRIVNEFGADAVPIWVQGGIGPEAAAACRIAGARGILLDVQLALAEEHECPPDRRALLEAMDGTETVCLGESLNAGFRVHRRVAGEQVAALQKLEGRGATREEFQSQLDAALSLAGEGALWPVGQEGALAASLAARHRNVGGMLRAYRKMSVANGRIAAEQGEVLGASGALAKAHGTVTAIVQGPMTRVSDVASFADEVAFAGGLPFLALATLRENAVDKLLQETSTRLGAKPWGVGILGFVPAELRAEQLRAVMRSKPRFALLAGGRADQAQKLEAANIATYLHAPTPRLLRMFLEKGVRRFVFEGRECGGHVGPLSSFLLWQQAVQTIRDFQDENGSRETVDVLFAGGIHDALSAAMATAIAAPLFEHNVRFGVLMGTAYLFTREAVASGAIAPAFQQEAQRCAQTALLDASGGHAIRCAPTPYVEEYSALKRRLLQSDAAPDELRLELEALNIGRLRLASKGIERQGDAPEPVEVELEEQRRRGMYMLGAVAALRDEVLTMAELHDEVVQGSSRILRERMESKTGNAESSIPTPIAVIGMACLYPDAPDVSSLWRNILRNHDAIREVPKERWDANLFYEAGTRSPDRVVSQWGGFLDEIVFDPMRYGIVPNALHSIEPNQILALETMRRALENAGYDENTRALPRERTGIVLGAGGVSDLGLAYGTRCMAEKYFHESDLDRETRDAAIGALRRATPEQTEDSFPGTLANVIAGRVANRLGFGGLNCVVDAACASSLAALETAVKDLRAGRSDVMLVGGVDTQQSAISFLSFSTTKALSPRGRCRPFDASADGIAISEGIGAVVLKRLEDAERDGDRIFAVVRDVAASSDGREKSLTAPAGQGQRRALTRAYENLEFTVADVSLIEAHGTGTVVGDRTELQSLRAEWEAAGASPQSAALGSIKSQIGHTKNAAGLAGLIKSALALHHRVLPPTLVGTPHEALTDRAQPLYLNTRPRPWLGVAETPRRAAVSAFGFGGTNFHAVLEEYAPHAAPTSLRPAELFVFRAASREMLQRELQTLADALGTARADWKLVDLAASLAQKEAIARGEHRIAIVAGDTEELKARLASALKALESNVPTVPGVVSGAGAFNGKIAVLFPGQGSQSLDMLRELAWCFPVVREIFERADGALESVLPQRLSTAIFPTPAYSPAEEADQRHNLNQTWLAQPALGVADYALFALLCELGVQPDMLAGHSYGEYVALCASGVFDFETLLQLSAERGRIAHETQGDGEVGMVAVQAGDDELRVLLESVPGAHVAARNAPQQSVIGGHTDALDAFCRVLDEKKIRYRKLALSAGFHIPEAQPAAQQLCGVLEKTPFASPQTPVYANLTAARHGQGADEICAALVEHLVKPLEFRRQLETMRADGAELFLEVGPKAVLCGLAQQTFGVVSDAPHIIATNRGDAAMSDFLDAVAKLYALGVPLKIKKLFAGVETQPLTIETLKAPPLPPTAWLVDGGAARPANAPARSLPKVHASEQGVVSQPKLPPSLEKLPNQLTPSQPAISSINPISPKSANPVMNHSTEHRSVPASPQTVAQSEAALALFQESMRQFLAYQTESQRQRQELMTRFLETQQLVLQSYLSGAPMPSVAALPPSTPLQEVAPVAALPMVPALSKSTPEPLSMTVVPNGHAHPQANILPPTSNPESVAVVSTPAETASTPAHASVPSGPVDLRAVVLDLVSERTGYPAEMLDLDHNMEADLGIDSIKRTEIFAGLRDQLNIDGDEDDQEEYFIQIAALRTLREVIEWLEGMISQQPEASPIEAVRSELNGHNGHHSNGFAKSASSSVKSLKRYVIRPELEALGEDVRVYREEEVVLITEDAGGRAREVVTGLRVSGSHVVTVRHADVTRVIEPGVYEVDLTSRAAVEQLRDWVHKDEGPITMLSHLLPLDPPADTGAAAIEVRSLFHLASVFGEDLKKNEGTLIAVTGMGGACGFGTSHITSHKAEFRAGAAALPGLLKSLALEWPEVFIKAIDVDTTEDEEFLLPQLIGEGSSTNRDVEAGHSSRGRVVPRASEVPLETDNITLHLDSDSVIVATGGARGITGAICAELAQRYGSRFVLIGRAPLSEDEGIFSVEELRDRELRRAREGGEMLTPAQIEVRVQSALRGQEIRETLALIEEYGAGCEYHALDVRETERLKDLLRGVHARFGRIDGVIHGAGVIEDALLLGKHPDAFDRVFDTKVQSALALAEVLDGEEFQKSLQFMLFFSSVSAHYGNPGQTDYAAANEVLNKLATSLDERWHARVAALGWGPWSGIGMASPHLRAKLAAAGFDYLAPRDGVKLCLDELCYGRKGESEVLLYAAHAAANHATQFVAREAAPILPSQALLS